MSQGGQKLAAVVLAAGKGTRMKSDRAKVLHEACGRPMAFFPIRAALSLDASPVVVVVGHQAKSVEEELSRQFPGAPLRFAVQAEQLGTAHAVLCAEEALRGHAGTVLILAADVPLIRPATLQRLIAARDSADVALLSCRARDPRGYGRVVRGPKGAVLRIVEEKDASEAERKIDEVNASIYAADARFLFSALRGVGRGNAQGEYYLTDIVERGRAVAVEAEEAEVSGVNDRAQLARSAAQLRERRNAQLMQDGVSFVDPAVTYVDEGIEVGADTVLEPMVSLRGRTRVGRGVRIGQGCVIVDSEIADGAQILPYTHMTEARIGPGATVGPFARLRPGAQLAEQAHVGNFVELKKTVLGKGSKANHLTYLGDAVVGEGCNIGAGTITCNYDGKNKHVTTIEDGAFIGSDTQLVAPLTVGKNAYVGTGTTLREDVPPGALAVSAGKQRNIEGWVAEKAPRKAPKKKEPGE
ncbi:MAG TPA: bifunctional UDP-N-acetylglucosamine diphosphorylase/glucosamine-1-phosphate N-acetyltransferase GlmU [Myxococcales bacterium]|nr:bifunctional UDP-N-acetylglucosamine diphosphorylase/glucosamine-1-phosphate N-acetyltransferase GlmU [Myxococcales bacterium]